MNNRLRFNFSDRWKLEYSTGSLSQNFEVFGKYLWTLKKNLLDNLWSESATLKT